MIKRFTVLVFVFVAILGNYSLAQDPNNRIDSLYKKALAENTDSGYVYNMLQSANNAFEFNKEKFYRNLKAAFIKADESRNIKTICTANIFASGIYSGRNNIAGNLDTALNYANTAFELVKNTNLTESQAWSNMALARIYRLKGQQEKALQYNQNALTLASISKSDSIQVLAYISLGNTFMEQSQKLNAFRDYMAAYDIADNAGNKFLLGTCYSKLAEFYSSIEQYEKAKDYLFKQLAVLKKDNASIYNFIPLYSEIAVTNIKAKQYGLAESYIDSGLAMCDRFKQPMLKMNLLDPLFQLYFATKNPQKIFILLNEKKDLIDQIKAIGYTAPIDYLIGSAYVELHQFDSAHFYLKKAAPYYETRASASYKNYFYIAYAQLYKEQGDWKNSLLYYNQVFDYAKVVGDLEMQKAISKELDSVYQKSGDYKKAYTFSGTYNQLSDSLMQLSKDKDLLSVELDNENKRKEREELRAEEATNRRHNIQYMAITVGIATVFLILILMGLFKVSAGTIRIIGFLAFIFFFEFVILLADVQIHHWTHGEPWKVLLIKIVLIAMLLPLHHWLEEKVIHHLTNKDLLKHEKLKFLSRRIKNSEPIS
jgi:tetratricopeptide (TPR) repeat protein